MNILLVAATPFEIQPTIDFLHTQQFRIGKNEWNILIAGIGGILTTYNLTTNLLANRPDYLIQAGIAGSFRPELIPGSVVCVAEELMGDLGAEEGNEFRDVFDLGLKKENETPFIGKILKNPNTEFGKKHGIIPVRSISVNEITTRRERIELLIKKYNPDIESMEGTAFHYVCLRESVPFFQIRAISNYVGERNKNNWSLGLAIDQLNKVIIDIVLSFE
jgi:futalosine hydrolase